MAYGKKIPLVVGFDKHDKDLIEKLANEKGYSQAKVVRAMVKYCLRTNIMDTDVKINE